MIDDIDIDKTIRTGYRWRKNNFSVWIGLLYEFFNFCVCAVFGLIAVICISALRDAKSVNFLTIVFAVLFSGFFLNYVAGLFIMRKMVSVKPVKPFTTEELQILLKEDLKQYKIETSGNVLYAYKFKLWSSFYPKTLIVITKGDRIFINQTSDLRGTSSPVPLSQTGLK